LDKRLEGKPVLIGGTSDRGVVASCSYEARQYGIHSAMPMKLAKQLCPHAVVIRGNGGTYAKFSDAVTNGHKSCGKKLKNKPDFRFRSD